MAATILSFTASPAAAKLTNLKMHVAVEECLGPKYNFRLLLDILISLLEFI